MPSFLACAKDDHHGNGDNLVHMTNVQLDLGDLRDPGAAAKVMQK